MKRILLLAALLAASPVAAQQAPPVPNASILAVNRSLSLSYVLSDFYYIEPSGVDAFNTRANYDDYEKGTLYGARLAASWMSDDLWYLHAEWTGSEGSVDYTGFTQITFQPVSATSYATTQDYSIKAGHGFAVAPRWMLVPYLSFGGRHWDRQIGYQSRSGFSEAYNHYYLSFGGLLQFSPSPPFVLTFDPQIGRTISPTIKDPPDGLDHAALGTAPIIKLAGEADYALSGALHAFVGADYTYFSYGQSSVFPVPGPGNFIVMEPNSHTEQTNVTLGLRYAY